MIGETLPGIKGYIGAEATAAHGRRATVAPPAITISRECGSGALSIARITAEILEDHGRAAGLPAWTIFDRELVECVVTEHKLPTRAARYMPEDRMPELRTAFEELLGLHPSKVALLEFTNKTILRLARAGHAIIVGRGGNIVTAGLPNVIHLRLVAPLETRVHEMQKQLEVSKAAALDHVLKTDRARARYLKRYFKANIDDPPGYHLTINTGRMSFEAAAQLIAAGIVDLKERLTAG